MIHVCYTLRDTSGRYSKFVGTSACSIFENTEEFVTIHILHDNSLNESNRDMFHKLELKYGQKILLYNVEQIAIEQIETLRKEIPNIDKHWATIAPLYKLLISKILPQNISRVICLDADTIVNCDIKKLWEIDMEGKSIAAMPESTCGIEESFLNNFAPVKLGHTKWNRYFQAGTLILNLESIRAHKDGDLFTRCLKYMKQFPSGHRDQDALNGIFANDFVALPINFNHYISRARKLPELKIEREIYHYVLGRVGLEMKDPFNRLWFSYFIKTSFCSPDSIWHFFLDMESSVNKLKKNADTKFKHAKKFFELSMKLPRIFFTRQDQINEIQKKFGIKRNDAIIDSAAKNSIETLIKIMQQTNFEGSNQKRVYLIHVDAKSYAGIRDKLKDSGFKENEDFFDIVGNFSVSGTFAAQDWLVKQI